MLEWREKLKPVLDKYFTVEEAEAHKGLALALVNPIMTTFNIMTDKLDKRGAFGIFFDSTIGWYEHPIFVQNSVRFLTLLGAAANGFMDSCEVINDHSATKEGVTEDTVASVTTARAIYVELILEVYRLHVGFQKYREKSRFLRQAILELRLLES